MNVPFLDIQTQHATLRAEILELWGSILDAAYFAGGVYVEAFEESFAEACETKHCIAVSNGTDALRLILEAISLNPGDEIITVPNTFFATVEAIIQAGAKPVFVDIDPHTYNIDVSKIEEVITPKTKGILPVHLYGQPADMDPILSIAEKNGLWVVEDAAQAHLAEYKGRRCGSLGLAAGFSFYPGKNLGACGEAGAVTTNDADLAMKIRMLRDHGQSKKYFHDLIGYNSRCDALQGAALSVKLRYLLGWTENRRKVASLYSEYLNDVGVVILPSVLDETKPSWHLYVVQLENREQIQKYLKEKGIHTGLHYPVPLHLQKALKNLGIKEGSFPVTEAYCSRLLSLPMYPELTEKQIEYVCGVLRSFVL